MSNRSRAPAGALAVFAAVSLATCTARAQYVQLDLSPALNYDAVATSTEIAANIDAPDVTRLGTAIGDHDIVFARAFAAQGTLGGAAVALPNDGKISGNGWDYQLSTAYDNGTGSAKSNNVVRVTTGNTPGTTEVTLTLAPSQQAAYDTINFAFTAHRAGTGASYRSFITATYTDSTADVLYDTGLHNATNDAPVGGTFGSAGVGANGGGFASAVDNNGDVLVLHQSNRILGTSGSPSVAVIRSGTGVLWQFATPLELDKTKVLQSLTIGVQTTGVNRPNTAYFFAAVAATPEPATAALLLPLVTLLQRRRRAGAHSIAGG